MYGIVISAQEFAESIARGQGHLKNAPADLKSEDVFAFMVWPLETENPVSCMRCCVGKVENNTATWERLGADLTASQIIDAKSNIIRRDQPIKYD